MRHLLAAALFLTVSFSGTSAHALFGKKAPPKPDYKAIKALKSPGERFEALLKEPYQSELLAFAKRSHTEENLLFILDVKGGKDKKAIYNRYIDLKGSMPINIKASIKAPLDALAAAKKWERLDFAEAVHACSEISIGQISNPFLDTK